MEKNKLSMALLLSESDIELLPSWIENHVEVSDNIVIGLDFPTGSAKRLRVDEVLEKNGVKNAIIFDCQLNNDFATARNSIMQRCEEEGFEWVLFLDADELLMPHSKQFFRDELSEIFDKVDEKTGDYLSINTINVFNRRFISPDTYANRLLKSKVRYYNNSPDIGASPGCHETPLPEFEPAGLLNITKFQILHLKQNWTSNFRAKGYKDSNQEAALEDLKTKIEATLS